MSRGRLVLLVIEVVLRWQECVIAELATEVDGKYWVPCWVFGDGLLPEHRIADLQNFADVWLRTRNGPPEPLSGAVRARE